MARDGWFGFASLSDAKRAEDKVKNVVGGGRSGDRIEGPKSAVEIEQQHFMRNFARTAAVAASSAASESFTNP